MTAHILVVDDEPDVLSHGAPKLLCQNTSGASTRRRSPMRSQQGPRSVDECDVISIAAWCATGATFRAGGSPDRDVPSISRGWCREGDDRAQRTSPAQPRLEWIMEVAGDGFAHPRKPKRWAGVGHSGDTKYRPFHRHRVPGTNCPPERRAAPPPNDQSIYGFKPEY
jgi:hypothetical protein